MHSIEQMVLTVTHYINVRKGVVVQLDLNQFREFKNVSLLQQAYNYAIRWFNHHNTQFEIYTYG